MITSTAMIILVWVNAHWEFERLAYYNGPDSQSICKFNAPTEVRTYAARGMRVRVLCQPNTEERA